MRVRQTRYGGPEMRSRIVPELGDERMLFERPLHHRALDALAAAVDQPHFTEASLVRSAHIFLHDVHDLTRREGMQVEEVFDRNLVHSPILRGTRLRAYALGRGRPALAPHVARRT